jgi:hypothetical protein
MDNRVSFSFRVATAFLGIAVTPVVPIRFHNVAHCVPIVHPLCLRNGGHWQPVLYLRNSVVLFFGNAGLSERDCDKRPQIPMLQAANDAPEPLAFPTQSAIPVLRQFCHL